MLRKAAGMVREISRIATSDRRLTMQRSNVLSLTKED
jgi:hypothetical protein